MRSRRVRLAGAKILSVTRPAGLADYDISIQGPLGLGFEGTVELHP
jgi:hypothetical protein